MVRSVREKRYVGQYGGVHYARSAGRFCDPAVGRAGVTAGAPTLPRAAARYARGRLFAQAERSTSLMRNLLKLAVVGMVLTFSTAMAQSCTVTIGSVMSLTGSLGVLGQKIAQGAQLGYRRPQRRGRRQRLHGSSSRCWTTRPIRRWASTPPRSWSTSSTCRPSSARCPAASATASSASVTAPTRSCRSRRSSTSPTLTQLATAGQDGGYWFRTDAVGRAAGRGDRQGARTTPA